MDNEDIYSYVMKVKTMQEIFQEKQKTNSGMAEFDLTGQKNSELFQAQR